MNNIKFLGAVIGVIVLAGCGTVSGIGQDLVSLGDIFSKGSDHYKEAVGKNPPGSKMDKE